MTIEEQLLAADSRVATSDSRLSTIFVPLRSRRVLRAKTMQKLQHALPAFALIASGMHMLSENPHGFALGLGVAEIVVSIVLIVTMARSVRAVVRMRARGETRLGQSTDRDPSPVHHGIDWVDVWSSAMLFVESAERYQANHRILRPSLLTAVGLLLIGLFHGRMLRFAERRRALRVTADEIYVGGKPFRSWRARWADVTGVTVHDGVAEISARGGRTRRIDLTDLLNAGEVTRALADVQRRLTERPS
jgi:hypothetical protein